MLKIAGSLIIIAASLGIGISLTDGIKCRINCIKSLITFVEYIKANITLYKTPLDSIYSSLTDKALHTNDFVSKLEEGVYSAAEKSGLLIGDEEKAVIKSFSDKIGAGTTDDMIKLCSVTLSGLKNIEEKLNRDYPDKRRVYHTVSLLAGATAIIILI